MDKTLIQPGEVGSMVVAKVGIDPYGRGEIKIPMGTKGMIMKKTDAKDFLEKYPMATWAKDTKSFYDIKWMPGGVMYQVLDQWIEPYQKK